MIQDIFKVPIWTIPLKLDNKSMATYCNSLKRKDKGRKISNEGGWQSNNLTGEHPKLNALFLAIEHNANTFAKELELKTPLVIDNIWININDYKSYNVRHRHVGAILSGVYYVSTPKDCGNIVFCNPDQSIEYDWAEYNHNKYNSYTSGRYWKEARANQLYLFPSWLFHEVEPNKNKKENRISISFNIKRKS